ncbi:uncharacterized protein LOC119546148 [Drosophila subpulchrella]|uniref:uncharacterized protein LOC119546148 n=1 Tax=Drosophila subpulchrella TaxID=1486046 RepID=UPI0018A172E5|nr:uncharacterized protein LOC119546148 [Drosophila subpulchrella]
MGYLISAACLLVLLIIPFRMGNTEEDFEEDMQILKSICNGSPDGITRVEHLVGLIDEYSCNASDFFAEEKDKINRTNEFYITPELKRNMGKSLLNFIVKKIVSRIFEEHYKGIGCKENVFFEVFHDLADDEDDDEAHTSARL